MIKNLIHKLLAWALSISIIIHNLAYGMEKGQGLNDNSARSSTVNYFNTFPNELNLYIADEFLSEKDRKALQLTNQHFHHLLERSQILSFENFHRHNCTAVKIKARFLKNKFAKGIDFSYISLDIVDKHLKDIMPPLKEMPYLQIIKFSKNTGDVNIIKGIISNLPTTITFLDFSHIPCISDWIFDDIVKFQKLRKLNLSHCDIVHGSYRIAQLTNLESLNLSENYQLKSTAVWHLQPLIKLKKIKLNQCGNINDYDLKNFLKIPSLEKIEIKETEIYKPRLNKWGYPILLTLEVGLVLGLLAALPVIFDKKTFDNNLLVLGGGVIASNCMWGAVLGITMANYHLFQDKRWKEFQDKYPELVQSLTHKPVLKYIKDGFA